MWPSGKAPGLGPGDREFKSRPNKSETEKKKAEAKMQEINEAHSFLSDEKKRRLYEQYESIEMIDMEKRRMDLAEVVEASITKILLVEKDEFIEEVKSSGSFYNPRDLDDFNGHLKRTLKKAEMLNERKKNLIDQERNNFLQQLKNLTGWNLLGEERQNEIIEEMKRNKTTDQFSDVLEMTKKEIAKIKGGNENDTNYLKTAANSNELQSRKREILDVIRATRRQKVLSEAIQKIKNALNQQPVIKNGELREIKQKRAKKEITGKLDELIRQAQTAIAKNDLITLEKLLNQIETYQSDSAYEERKTDIERLFQQLASVSLPKYRELTINSLDEFLRQDPPLSLDELEKANQNFAEQIKNASSAEEIKNIKNSVSNNINQGRSNKIVVNLINQAKQARTEEEKSAVRQKISELENSGNKTKQPFTINYFSSSGDWWNSDYCWLTAY
ncbi:7891_t:CDS:2 [Racocetra fulgida]|uniref:7891_t:CDS:1 n=1 Tax=Racocetra fulgida TaxID=60492 RepID=A0A9N8YTR4_9GLOM|nr:7891_t:CDS:2 [Racocetra fulgida]